MKVLVLGAGVVGITTAWYLREAGHDVLVVDRASGPGRETSFANGGQISVSQAEPWANPRAPAKIVRWLNRDDAPLLFRWPKDSRQWAWCLEFLWQCLPHRTRANTAALVRLGLYSRAQLRELRQHTGIEYDHQERGILQIYDSAAELERARLGAELLRRLGCDTQLLSVDGCVAVEPALGSIAPRLAGGIYAPDDESGDAHRFSVGLAQRCAEAGVGFYYDCRVEKMEPSEGQLRWITVLRADGKREELRAGAYVVALGSYSAPLLRPLGISIPVYPLKGYSVTLPLADASLAPRLSITDEAHKVVITPLGDRLRAAGTAELNGYDTSINPVRCNAILTRVMQLFPGAGDAAGAEFWAGLRPATPGNVPVIGKTRYANLFLNTGHGTLGWTLACGSARALADILVGRTPPVPDFPFR